MNYLVRTQTVRGLTVGRWEQTQPPDIAFEVRARISKNCRAYVVVDDLVARGVHRDEVLDGLGFVARAELPALLRAHEHIWQW